MRLIPVFILFLSIKLLGNTNIVDINVEQTVGKEVQLKVQLDSKYSGVMVRRSGNDSQKIVLNGAIIDKRYSKSLVANSIVSKIDIHPFPNRTNIIFFSTHEIDIIYETSEDQKSINIKVRKKIGDSTDKIEPEGESLFLNLSSGYIITLIILAIISGFMFYMRNKIDSGNVFPIGQKDDSNNWLLDKDNQRLSLKSIQPPDWSFNIRKNPNSLDDKLSTKLDDPLAKSVKREAKKPEKEEFKVKNSIKNLKKSKHVDIIFDDNLDRGRVYMLKILETEYLIFESFSGETTLLNKFEKTDEPKDQKIGKKNLVMPLQKKDVTIIDKNFDIKLPIEDNSKDEKTDLKDIFKDSQNLKI